MLHGRWREASIPSEMEILQIREESEKKGKHKERKKERQEEEGRQGKKEGVDLPGYC